MERTQDTKFDDRQAAEDRRALVRYAALTAALFVPLLLAFASIRNLYPFAASTMMLGDRDMQSARDYYKLRGETVGGETIDLPPIKLTNALSGRNWGLVSAAVENKSFNIPSPQDRKSTRLNSSHLVISYAVFCLKKKKKDKYTTQT